MSSVSTSTPERPLGEKVKDPSPAPFPSKTLRLQGKHITIVPLSPSHAPALFPLIGGEQNSHLWDYMPYDPFPRTLSDLTSAMETKSRSTDPTFYTFLSATTGEPLGWGSYLRISPPTRVLEIGHLMFSKHLQRSVAATEAMFLLADHAFRELGYRRYEWKCHDLNAASKRAALRLGFKPEGVFRQHLIDKFGRNRDTAWFSVLDGEWEGLRRAFLGWLDEDNFDGEGRQKRRLEEFREG